MVVNAGAPELWDSPAPLVFKMKPDSVFVVFNHKQNSFVIFILHKHILRNEDICF